MSSSSRARGTLGAPMTNYEVKSFILDLVNIERAPTSGHAHLSSDMFERNASSSLFQSPTCTSP
eukprot:6174650-Pleurochrysis_carterae.AAC.1